MSATRAFWLIPFRHAVPADLERWFEQHAAEGLVADRLRQWSSIRMRLTRRPPAMYRYVVDVQAAPRTDYRTTYEDLGWEHVGQMASIHVWRRTYTGQRPEAFTDRTSATGRDLRFAMASGAAAVVLLLVALVLAIVAAVADVTANESLQLWLAAGLIGVVGIAVAVATLAIVRARNRRDLDRAL